MINFGVAIVCNTAGYVIFIKACQPNRSISLVIQLILFCIARTSATGPLSGNPPAFPLRTSCSHHQEVRHSESQTDFISLLYLTQRLALLKVSSFVSIQSEHPDFLSQSKEIHIGQIV